MQPIDLALNKRAHDTQHENVPEQVILAIIRFT